MLTTADYLFAVTVYVAFRNIHPEIETILQVEKNLKENNIDITQLKDATANHCP